MKTTKVSLIILSLLASNAYAEKHDDRGLLPEVRLDSKNEDENVRRSVETEILVTRAETKAIESLQNILKRKKGTAEEPELLHRLAEMQMRRARTGRFFDLTENTKTLKLSSFPLPPEKGADWIRKASAVYSDIEKRFPNYRELDSVLFNNAFANQQLNKIRESEALYQRLIDKKPNSRLVPDAAVALGELAYDQRRFALAMNHFETAEKFPESRVYTYALYKDAWTQFNMKDADKGVQKLLEVVKACPADFEGDQAKNRQNLRKEALRDLAIFLGDSRSPQELYAFFKPIETEEELGQSMMDLSKLYLSYGRFKDMNIFLGEFNEKNPKNAFRLKTLLTLVDANESLKDRAKVLDYLRTAATECHPDSAWRKAQTPEMIEESCGKSFRNKTHEVAGKWWEIWQKNKTHKEFSSLTEQALKVVLDNQDVSNPDVASRFAYAELLFQLDRFDEASKAYHQAAEEQLMALAPQTKDAKPLLLESLKPEERKKLHASDYGALFSLEKALEKKKSAALETERKEMAQLYLKRHPKGDHAGEVTLRMAVILYDEQNFEGSSKWLDPLLVGAYGRDLQVKAEDLSLDILNLKKDYKGLSARSQVFLQREKDEKRRENLKKIEIEASYSSLQEELKTVEKVVAASRLKAFAESHPGMKLASEALYQAAALDFVDGRGLAAAQAMENFAKALPDDQRTLNGLKDSARASAEAGEMLEAARLLKTIAEKDPKNKNQHMEAAGDFLLMENQIKEARAVYQSLLTVVPTSDRPRLYTKLLETFKNDPHSPEVTRLEGLVLQQNLEPFATQVLTKRAQNLFEAGKRTEAFEAARKIVGRDASAEQRAEARLIQARILESEFISQSVKSSREDRFGMVLAMKTEKLEKAQTAFLSASKMTSDPKILAEAFAGIDRCYSNYADTLEHLQLPASLPEADQAALRVEIGKILVPIRAKRDENRKQVRQLASVSISSDQQNRFKDLSGDSSPIPQPLAQWTFLKPFLTETWTDGPEFKRLEMRKPTCDGKKPDFTRCFLSGKLEAAEKVAREMTQAKATRVGGWHHLALIAESRGLTTKALWLLRLAEKENSHHPLIRYEKGRLLSQVEGNAAASADFAEVLKSSMSSTEIGILRGFKAFSEGDFGSVKMFFSGFSKQEIHNLNIGSLLSESLAQAGETDQALKLITELSSQGPSADLLIQQGRLNEVYKFAPLPALEAYQKALKLAKDPAQKEWLERKTEYLKVNFKVGLYVPSAD